MNKEEYQKLVEKYTPKENKKRNAIVSFITGGIIGLSGEIIATILQNSFGMEKMDAYVWLCVILIVFASISTAFGFFDTWVSKCKAGLFLPTTGFAHSITSAALDYRKDGMITGLGSNFFKLAGSVLLYGILSGFFFAILGVIIYG